MAQPERQQKILLESGSNEVELAEFVLNSQHFGVNVAKIREFLPYGGVAVTKMPGSPSSVLGVFLVRGQGVPLIDLAAHLELGEAGPGSGQVVVITEFNNLTTAFIADKINRIHRLSWSEFKPLNQLLGMDSPQVTGSVNLDGREVLILDLEHIIGEIIPESVINYQEKSFERPLLEQRREARIIFAEDSTIIRTQVSKILKKVGYVQVAAYGDGEAALQAVLELREKSRAESLDIGDLLNLVISDIEMPRLDGLTLCRKIKADLGLDIPVIMFSSLINKQMAAKCRAVGADAFASKPETEKLISLVDRFCLNQAPPQEQ
jgi:two-component system chemotaxis response regulator CheV